MYTTQCLCQWWQYESFCIEKNYFNTFQSMIFWIFNHTIAEDNINISGKESFFEYNELIKTTGRDQIYDNAFRALFDSITPTVCDNIILKEWFSFSLLCTWGLTVLQFLIKHISSKDDHSHIGLNYAKWAIDFDSI